MTDDGADPRVGSVIAGRYRALSRLGEGGMGAVYLTEHVHMKKHFALKVLHRELTHDDQMVARFEREAIAAGRIEHHNVVAAKDFGRLEDGSFYLVLEYVVGSSLRQLMRQGPIEQKRALSIARQIVSALGAAHAAGIIHRDLKPDNVMLVDSGDGSDQIKVLDFGIAKLSQEDLRDSTPLTQIGSVFGTPEYMSPEQAMGQAVDHRSDLYALGVVLFEMLSGHPPFESDEPIAVITNHMVSEPPPLPGHIDPRIVAVVTALLAKSPDQRPQSADELGFHLDSLLRRLDKSSAPEPITPSPAASAGTIVGYASPTRFAAGLGSAPGAASSPAAAPPPPSEPVRRELEERPLEPAHLLQLLKRSVRIKTALVPVWVLGSVVLALLVMLAVVPNALLRRGSATPGAAPGEGTHSSSELAERARRGDAAAVTELESQPQDELELDELIALGSGRLRLGRTRAAIAAYRAGVERDASVVKRADLIRDLRRAADDPAASRDALELAATSFGAAGADIVFDVRERAEEDSSVARHADELLDSPRVQSAASEALRIALDLSRAKKCAEFKQLLPRAIRNADRRSLVHLEKLTKKRGCGRRARHDCFRCLRSGSDLDDALQRARTTPAPILDSPVLSVSPD